MSARSKITQLVHSGSGLLRSPRLMTSVAASANYIQRGFEFARSWQADTRPTPTVQPPERPSPLREFADARVEGRGIWKWDHYHDVYHQHLQKFIGQEVHVMEVGVYSGGSLEMWREYFGPKCHIYGVDVEEACRCYENDHTTILIGDQQDRGFWQDVRQSIPRLDVLIDDGGHEAEQQVVTLEEMLPHLQPGGVFVCEDIRGDQEGFAAFTHGLASSLNSMGRYFPDGQHATPFQSNVAAIHNYPFITVVEKTAATVERFVGYRRGTEWQPFLGEYKSGAKSEA